MSSPGATLRQARTDRGVSLHDLARRTKIQVWMLEAIERDDFEVLPTGVFVRGFLSAFAREVHLDPDAVLSEYLAFTQPTPRPVQPGQPVQPVAPAPPSASGTRRAPALTMLSTVAIAGAVLAGMLWFKFDLRSLTAQAPESVQKAVTTLGSGIAAASPTAGDAQPNTLDAPPPSDVPPPSDAPPPSGASSTPVNPQPRPTGAPSTSLNAPPASADRPAAAPAASTLPADPAGPGIAGPSPTDADNVVAHVGALTIDVHAVTSVWLEGSADGQRQIYGLLNPGDRQHVQAQHEITLRVGDASALELSINGAPARALGSPGEVRDIRITPDNYKTFLEGAAPGEGRSDR